MLVRTVRYVLPLTVFVALGLWCHGGLGAQAPAPGQSPPAARPAPRAAGSAPPSVMIGMPTGRSART